MVGTYNTRKNSLGIMHKSRVVLEGPNNMRVTFYQRRPQGANFSVERLFATVRRALPDDIRAVVAVSRFPSRGFWGRLYNMIEAIFRQGDVNHITGDVHFLACFLHGKKTLLTILDFVSMNRLKGWRRAILFFIWYWLPIKRVSMVSVISEYTKNELLRHIKVDPRKVCVVYNPVSPDFQPVVCVFNSEKPVVLQVGTGANKNVERVAQALRGIPCHLRLIGKLNEEQLAVLRRSGVEYSSVFDISDDQIVDEYRKCDMLVFVSTYEGFGMPIIEAQATGRPVITSNVCSMPEVAGDAACLVDPFDIQSIRHGIMRVIKEDDYRASLVKKGYANVKRFGPEIIARQYVGLYREILKN